MTFEPAKRLLAFVLPSSFQKGDVTFFSATQASDFRVPIKPNGQARQLVPTDQLAKGRWLARLQWSDGRVYYSDEQEILVS
ncbi:FixH family protein [Salmonirosea aquatica]|uniref:Uncharacterized protein n=1 Tax=Salmonirosea aquatica TaxID=2654236 RepID=A0A7C9BEN3_9BACT|nr:hypothetical protein [Cytophagaceae bacterium SJW1-29]